MAQLVHGDYVIAKPLRKLSASRLMTILGSNGGQDLREIAGQAEGSKGSNGEEGRKRKQLRA